ncbi:MAG: chemotaxis protein CheA [Candidatus Thermoplasmatota archaeon]|nr:chemotaxis protein CheA [Candidatus Thermoplasmatota archaeon]MBS3790279.1 chemotaxis protein CheA [Candidatus Thermoplasmatota archaeon]
MSEKYQEMFEEETKEQIEEMNENLLSLEENPDDSEIIDEIYRASHTLKGMAGTMGYEGIQNISHKMEELFDELKEKKGRIDEDLFDLLFECVDTIEILAAGEDADFQYLIDELDKTLAEGDNERGLEDIEDDDKLLEEFEIPVEIKEVLENHLENDITLAVIDVSKDEEFPPVRALELREKLDLEYEIFYPDPEEVDSDHHRFFLVTEDVLDENDLDKTVGLKIDLKRDEGKNLLIEREGEDKDKKNSRGKVKKIETSDKLKVDLEDIEQVMNLISELVISKGSLEDISRSIESDRLSNVTSRIDRISSDLRESVLDLKMTKAKTVFRRFPRMVRDLAKENDKEIDFKLEGEDIELDRTILDRITDPLVHLIRNAIDHGIEPVEERKQKGKPPEGKIKIAASQKEENVVIEVSDDGRGLDKQKIKEKAIEKGLISKEDSEEILEENLYLLIFNSHFSTKDEVTKVSGRGVGMEVVKETMDSLGGEVNIMSEKGEGTTVRLTLPPSVAIVQAFLIEVGTGTYALSMEDVVETAQVRPEDIENIKDNDLIRLRNEYLPLIYLKQKFEDVSPESIKENNDKLKVVIVSKEDKTAGFVIDEIITEKEIVIKPLPEHLQNLGGFMGATILGDGTIAMILDTLHWVETKA